MAKIKRQVAVLGAGGWGTTLALLLHRNGHQVGLWAYEETEVTNMRERGENTRFLPGVSIPREIAVSTDMESLLPGAELIVMSSPSQAARSVMRRLAGARPSPCPIVNVSKGIENKTLKRMSEMIREELPFLPPGLVATLSGPSHAEEVSRGLPTVVVTASDREQTALFVQETFMCDLFRVYTSSDLVGVELAGSLKNVIALATGVCDGLGFGDNSKGALLTRGLAEITRLGLALGAKASTFAGLAGMGDLITTCMSRHSRNRYVGEQIGKGRRLPEILGEMVMVAEGVRTTESAMELGNRVGVELPITREVYEALFHDKDAHSAVAALMMRPAKPEDCW